MFVNVASKIFEKHAYQGASPPFVHPDMCSRTDFTMSIIGGAVITYALDT